MTKTAEQRTAKFEAKYDGYVYLMRLKALRKFALEYYRKASRWLSPLEDLIADYIDQVCKTVDEREKFRRKLRIYAPQVIEGDEARLEEVKQKFLEEGFPEEVIDEAFELVKLRYFCSAEGGTAPKLFCQLYIGETPVKSLSVEREIEISPGG